MPFALSFDLPTIDCRRKTGEEKEGCNSGRFRTNPLNHGDVSGEEGG